MEAILANEEEHAEDRRLYSKPSGRKKNNEITDEEKYGSWNNSQTISIWFR